MSHPLSLIFCNYATGKIFLLPIHQISQLTIENYTLLVHPYTEKPIIVGNPKLLYPYSFSSFLPLLRQDIKEVSQDKSKGNGISINLNESIICFKQKLRKKESMTKDKKNEKNNIIVFPKASLKPTITE